MRLFNEIPALVKYLNEMRLKGISIGLVPTMGYLHEGHITLIKNSVKENDLTVCSIFVNPTQFNNPEDLHHYPRNTERDIAMLTESKCDVAFIPEADDMYTKDRVLKLDFGYLEEILEGKFRSGHFKGVGLIVSKLFNIVQPDRAYFGTKDLQQLVIINKLTEELNYNIVIRPVETVREESGLAMSSRNARLTDTEKEQAIILYSCLMSAKKMFLEGKEIDKIKEQIIDKCGKSTTFDLEYFEIVNTNTMLPVVSNVDPSPVSACMAGYVGKVRLIDNISII